MRYQLITLLLAFNLVGSSGLASEGSASSYLKKAKEARHSRNYRLAIYYACKSIDADKNLGTNKQWLFLRQLYSEAGLKSHLQREQSEDGKSLIEQEIRTTDPAIDCQILADGTIVYKDGTGMERQVKPDDSKYQGLIPFLKQQYWWVDFANVKVTKPSIPETDLATANLGGNGPFDELIAQQILREAIAAKLSGDRNSAKVKLDFLLHNSFVKGNEVLSKQVSDELKQLPD